MQELDQTQTGKCKFCGSRAGHLLDQQASAMTYVISVISLVFLGMWGIIIIPLIIQATKTIVKRCHDCSEILEKHDLFSIPSFNDNVLTFKFGHCAIILSRKYAYVLIALFVTLYCMYGKQHDNIQQKQQEDLYQKRTWISYINDCGKDQFVSNGVRAKSNYNRYYQNKILSWEGIFLQIKESNKLLNNAQYGIFIKMNPSESIDEIPDIVLALDENQFSEKKGEIENLQKGQIIQFQAKIEHMGDEFSYHVARLISFTITDQIFKIENIQQYSEETYRKYVEIDVSINHRNRLAAIHKMKNRTQMKMEINLKKKMVLDVQLEQDPDFN